MWDVPASVNFWRHDKQKMWHLILQGTLSRLKRQMLSLTNGELHYEMVLMMRLLSTRYFFESEFSKTCAPASVNLSRHKQTNVWYLWIETDVIKEICISIWTWSSTCQSPGDKLFFWRFPRSVLEQKFFGREKTRVGTCVTGATDNLWKRY